MSNIHQMTLYPSCDHDKPIYIAYLLWTHEHYNHKLKKDILQSWCICEKISKTAYFLAHIEPQWNLHHKSTLDLHFGSCNFLHFHNNRRTCLKKKKIKFPVLQNNVQPRDFIWRPFVFQNSFIFINVIWKTYVIRHFKAGVSNFLFRNFGYHHNTCGTQITPRNKNVVFFKGFPHGIQILKLNQGCCFADIHVFGAQNWDSQLSNDVSHVLLL